MTNKLTYIFLGLIVLLSILLRFYKLDTIPTSLNWDEIAAGYNAYTIANWGADEYGNKFPVVFKSFADDKHPVHIYITAAIVKMFGLSDFKVRKYLPLNKTVTIRIIFRFIFSSFTISHPFFKRIVGKQLCIIFLNYRFSQLIQWPLKK